jgi:hypothetical protein
MPGFPGLPRRRPADTVSLLVTRSQKINPQPKEADTMETAKVDIRKLQLLNDRINQCIDALNQVRLSVHGLSGASTGAQQAGIGAGQNPGFENLGLSHTGFGQNPFAQQGIGQGIGFGTPSPFAQVPGQGYFPGFAPVGFPQLPYPPQSGAFGIGVNPALAGLGHTSPESLGLGVLNRPMWADPLMTARIVQTFPYAQLPIPPVVTIY